jgi:UDP-GlcNAc:undecaprenyl-phosphate GlcNAc-1-phosphate transferase
MIPIGSLGGPASWLLYALTFIVATLLSLRATPVMRRAAIEFGITDKPDGKLKTHREPVAYLGGLAVYGSFLVALALTFDFTPDVLGLLLAGAIVVILGLVDDLARLGPRVKLAGQALAVWVLVKSGIYIKLAFLPFWAQIALTVVWLLAITNAFNLIDIMDGLSSGVAIIAALVLLVVAAAAGRVMIATLLPERGAWALLGVTALVAIGLAAGLKRIDMSL